MLPLPTPVVGGLWSWRPAARPYARGRTQLLLPCPAVVLRRWPLGTGSGCQPGPLLITMVVLTSVNKELISCAVGLRTAVRWHYVNYNWCGPDSRSLLTCNLLGHIVSSAICTVVDILSPGSPQLKSSV